MDTLLTESMVLVSLLLCFSASGKLQKLRGISAKTVTQLELIGYHACLTFRRPIRQIGLGQNAVPRTTDADTKLRQNRCFLRIGMLEF